MLKCLYHCKWCFLIKITFNQSVSFALHKRWNFDLEEILFNNSKILSL